MKPTKDQAVLPGVQKLLGAAEALGFGAGYSREATPLAGTVSFATGNPDDPDGRVGLTADGLLVIETTTRTPQKPKKGAQPDKVTGKSRTVDLQGSVWSSRSSPIPAAPGTPTCHASNS